MIFFFVAVNAYRKLLFSDRNSCVTLNFSYNARLAIR